MGKPFLQMKLQQNNDLLSRLRQLPERSQRNIRRKIVTELVPYLERRANELMMEPWIMPSSPFVFGTRRSKRFYFAMIHDNPELTDGSHWIRTMRLESSFQFEASDRLRGTQVTGRAAEGDARYVFGPWAVAGHINTGWPERVEQVREILQEEMRRMISRLWREAVREALDGQG